MYISLKWLQNFVNLSNISLSVLCEKLTLAGFEIESTTEKKILENLDIILDVSLTANRPDIFNINEFSKEISTIFDSTLEKDSNQKKNFNKAYTENSQIPFLFFSKHNYKHFIQRNYFFTKNEKSLANQNFEKCSFFLTLENNSLIVKNSPPWIQKFLIASNILPINNIIDTIHLVLLETGYSFTVYDLSKLQNLTNSFDLNFKTRLANKNETFKFSIEKEFNLTEDNLLVSLNGITISVATLLEPTELCVTKNTTKILIQSALFDPIQIRKSSQQLGLRTEASTRSEKRLNINSLEKALIRLYNLFYTQNIFFRDFFTPHVKHIALLENSIAKEYVPIINLIYDNVNQVLGPLQNGKFIDKNEIGSILKRLHFQIELTNNETCKVYVPSSRISDIVRPIDLIEEIGRIKGFDNFKASNPNSQCIGKLSKIEKLKRKLRLSFLNFGLYEVLHPTLLANLRKNQIVLKNPLLNESAALRLSLLDLLLERLVFNNKQGNGFIEAFEIGRIYHFQNNGSFLEREVISGIFGGKTYQHDWEEKEKNIKWLEAKGLLEDIFENFNIKPKWQIPDQYINNLFHPGKIAEIYINSEKLGIFGQIHPNKAKIYDLNKELYLFEFYLDTFEKFWCPKQFVSYVPYSFYPNFSMDLSCVVPKHIPFEEIETKINKLGQPLLQSINLFDYYCGEQIPSGYYSIGVKLKFREKTRTLKTSEIDLIMEKIKKELESSLKITFRTKI